ILAEAVRSVCAEVLGGIVDRFRPGIGGAESQPRAEAAFQGEVQAVVAGTAQRVAVFDLAEIWIRQDWLTLRVGQNPEPIVEWLVQIAQRVQVRGLGADIVSLYKKTCRQLALNSETPLLDAAVGCVRVGGADLD